MGGLTLPPREVDFASAVIDSAGGFAYFGTLTSPGVVVELDLSAFTRVGILTLASGDDRFTSAVIDARSGCCVSFGTAGGGVVMVGSGPVRIAGLALSFGACCFTSAVIDSAHGFAFFGTDTSPGRVVEVKLSDFTRVDILTLPSGEDHLTSAVIDSVDTAHPAYFGTDTGRVVKVELTDGVDLKGNPAKVLTRVGGLTLPSGEDHLTSAVIDSAGGFA